MSGDFPVLPGLSLECEEEESVCARWNSFVLEVASSARSVCGAAETWAGKRHNNTIFNSAHKSGVTQMSLGTGVSSSCPFRKFFFPATAANVRNPRSPFVKSE